MHAVFELDDKFAVDLAVRAVHKRKEQVDRLLHPHESVWVVHWTFRQVLSDSLNPEQIRKYADHIIQAIRLGYRPKDST